MSRVQKQIIIAVVFFLVVCEVLVLCVAPKAEASTSSLRDQVRIRNGVIQIYEGGSWNNVASVDALNAEDPFFLAKDKRAEIDKVLSQKNAEVAYKALLCTADSKVGENILADVVTPEDPQETSTRGNYGYYSGGRSGGSGWSGSSESGGSGGGAAPSAPSNPPTGQEVLNPWSPDVM